MPEHLEMDEITGEFLCPGCMSPALIMKSDKRGNRNYICTNCGWARLGTTEFPVEKDTSTLPGTIFPRDNP